MKQLFSSTIRSNDVGRLAALIFFIALIVRLGFIFSGGNMLDDAFITMRVARNIANGVGFVYNSGDRIQATSSFLYSLLAAGIYYFTGDHVLWIVRVVGSLCDALAAFLIVLIVADCGGYKKFSDTQNRIHIFSAMFAGLYYALLSTGAIVVTQGLETGIYTFVITLTFRCLQVKMLKFAAFVSALATLLRPDGMLLVLIVFLYLFWIEKRIPWQELMILGMVVVPYILFTTSYFGSLIPQTVIAKGLTVRFISEQWMRFLNKFFWGGASVGISGLFCLIGLKIVIQDRRDILPIMLWTITYVAFFSTLAAWWPWYFPPVLIGYCIAVGLGIGSFVSYLYGLRFIFAEWQAAKFVCKRNLLNRISLVFALLMTSALMMQLYRSSSFLGRTTFDSRQKIELANWIKSNTSLDVTVMVEPLGMIAYYTDRRFDDYPGLASRRVTDAVKQLDRRISGTPVDYQALKHILLTVKPDILILRQDEYEINMIHGSLEYYKVVFVSPIPPEITAQYGDLQNMIVLTRLIQDNNLPIEGVDRSN